MAEHELMDDADLAEGSSRIMEVDGVEIGVIKSNGIVYAFRNICPHEGGPVCTGTVTGHLEQGPETNWELKWARDGEVLYCPWHGTDFDLCTSKSMSKKPLQLKTYPVKVEDGKITITM